jgi:hypothetical protein
MQFFSHLTKHVHHIHAKFKLSSFYPDGFKQIFEIFPKMNFSGKLIIEFQKTKSKYLGGLGQNFDLFLRKM